MFVIKQTDVFSSWLRGLRDQKAKQKITGRLQRLKFGHFGDAKPVSHGVSELRIHEGKGYRVYFRQQEDKIIFLLCGGDKKSQQGDIAQAQRIWKELGNET